MSMIMEEVVTTRLDGARPGPVELRGGKVVASLQFGDRGAVWTDDRNDLVTLITAAHAALRAMDDAIYRRENGQPEPAAVDRPLTRPYTPVAWPEPAAPLPASSQIIDPAPPAATARHAAPKPASPPVSLPAPVTSQPSTLARAGREGQVVPDPHLAAEG